MECDGDGWVFWIECGHGAVEMNGVETGAVGMKEGGGDGWDNRNVDDDDC